MQKILQEILKKKILGTSDASSQRPREPAYYIEDCRISSCNMIMLTHGLHFYKCRKIYQNWFVKLQTFPSKKQSNIKNNDNIVNSCKHYKKYKLVKKILSCFAHSTCDVGAARSNCVTRAQVAHLHRFKFDFLTEYATW